MENNEKVLWSIKNGDVVVLKEELAKHALHVDDKALTNNTRPAIVYAADYGQTDVIKYLLENGSNINVQDDYGITPLLAAIWEEHTSAVELLLSKGANKDLKSPDGKSYMDEAPSETMKNLLLK